MKLQNLLPFAALALIAFALYLAYKSQRVASPYLSQQNVLTPLETNWVTVAPGVTTMVMRQDGQTANIGPVYAGGAGGWDSWKV